MSTRTAQRRAARGCPGKAGRLAQLVALARFKDRGGGSPFVRLVACKGPRGADGGCGRPPRGSFIDDFFSIPPRGRRLRTGRTPTLVVALTGQARGGGFQPGHGRRRKKIESRQRQSLRCFASGALTAPHRGELPRHSCGRVLPRHSCGRVPSVGAARRQKRAGSATSAKGREKLALGAHTGSAGGRN